jgi:hypothetical protein
MGLSGQPSQLFRANGDGTFTNVSGPAGLLPHRGKGLGVVAVGLDGDRRIDVFRSNDATPNFLYRNRGDGTFAEMGLEAGVAYGPEGVARGGMGIDVEDVRQVGRPDVFVANFTHETNAYFRNDGDWLFTETTLALGLGGPSFLMSGFGARFLDYDADGDLDLDLFVNNGHPLDTIKELYPTIDCEMAPLLLESDGGAFRNVAAER